MRRRRSHPLYWQAGRVRRWEGWPDYLEAIGLTVAVVVLLVEFAVIAWMLGAQP